jgi:hypothetical protein
MFHSFTQTSQYVNTCAVDLGRYLSKVRIGQYWRFMTIHEHLL